jgi:hypothetical protein
MTMNVSIMKNLSMITTGAPLKTPDVITIATGDPILLLNHLYAL